MEMILTRGVSPTFSRDPRDAVNTFIAFAIPLGSIANDEQRARGLDLHVASIPRIQPDSVDPTVKNYHWLDLVAGLYQAYDHGRENVVLVDGAGNVTEGPGFNVFSVKDGAITTPAVGGFGRHHPRHGHGARRGAGDCSGPGAAQHRGAEGGGRDIHHLHGRRHHARDPCRWCGHRRRQSRARSRGA